MSERPEQGQTRANRNGVDSAGDKNWQLISAIFSNSYRAPHPWVDATGFRTHSLRFRALGHTLVQRQADDYLINSRYSKYDRETEESIQSYFMDPGVVMLSLLGREDRAGLEQVVLPPGVKLRREVGQVLAARRSRRDFTGDRLELPYLATLLRSALAITATAHADRMDGSQSVLSFRVAPSAGGLYPIDLYFASLRLDRIKRGIWRYDPITDAIYLLGNEAQVDDLMGAIAVPEEIIAVSRACTVLLLVGYPQRLMRKYGPRAARFLFLEAGAIAQNVHLACEALGLGSVDCASVFDDQAHEALELDGVHQMLAHAVVVGHPA